VSTYSSAGWDTKTPHLIVVRNSEQTPEEMELELPPKNLFRVNESNTFMKKLPVETFLVVNRYATAGNIGVGENIMEGKSLETEAAYRKSARNVDKFEPKTTASTVVENDDSTTDGRTVKSRAVDNVVADWDQVKAGRSKNVLVDINSPVTADGKNITTNEVLEQTTQKDVNNGKILGLSSDTEMVAIVGNSAVDNKHIKSPVSNNNIRSGEDWNQTHTDFVSAVRDESSPPLRASAMQKTSKDTISIRRKRNNNDEDKTIESESEEMRNYNITNEDYIDDINSTTPCNRLFSVVITDWKIFPNGSLLSLDDTRVLYPPEYFWKELKDDNDTEVRGCLCLLRNCIRKCCPEGQTLTKDDHCVPSNLTLLHPFSPQFIDENTNKPVKNVDVHRIYGNPCSYGSYLLDPAVNPADQFTLLLTGMLSAPAEGNFTVAQYCIEAFEEQKAVLPLLCFQNEETDGVMEDTSVHVLYPVGLIISVPFLFATFVVYAAISELRNLHGKSLMCHVSSLLTAYVFLAVVQLGGEQLSTTFCIFCGKCS
jgi:hypothetical protein